MVAQRAPLVILTMLAAGCGRGEASSSGSNALDPVTQCASRGTAYFERIGSYPTLHEPPNAGRAAEEVALERCRENPAAF